MSMLRQTWAKWLAGLIGLNILMSTIFLVFLLGFPLQMGLLIREPAKAAIADGRGFAYLILLAVGALVYEVVCRGGIQRNLTKKGGVYVRIGYGICGVLASLIYLRFGIIPAVLGGIIGVTCACLYSPQRSRFFMVWQIQWQFGQMAITLLIALVMLSESRAQYLWAYKLRNLREGKLCYRPDWGWIDASHSHTERFDMIMTTLEKASGSSVSVTVNEPFVTITRQWLPVVQSYEIVEPATLTAADRWAVASGISMDFSKRNEEAQGNVPFYRCSQMSAWQFDDLPSTLLTCLMRAPGSLSNGDGVIADQKTLEALWNEQGIDLVRHQFRETELPELADRKLAPLLEQIHLAKGYWRPSTPPLAQ